MSVLVIVIIPHSVGKGFKALELWFSVSFYYSMARWLKLSFIYFYFLMISTSESYIMKRVQSNRIYFLCTSIILISSVLLDYMTIFKIFYTFPNLRTMFSVLLVK